MYVDMPESAAEKRKHCIHLSFYFRWTDRHVGLWITKQLCRVMLGALTTDHLEFGLFLIFTEFFVCLPWVSQLGVRKLG